MEIPARSRSNSVRPRAVGAQRKAKLIHDDNRVAAGGGPGRDRDGRDPGAALALDPPGSAPAARDPQIGQSFQVPYRLTDTNHFLVRVRINGKGPFNFLVDSARRPCSSPPRRPRRSA